MTTQLREARARLQDQLAPHAGVVELTGRELADPLVHVFENVALDGFDRFLVDLSVQSGLDFRGGGRATAG